jgi:hypothetical protein
LLMHNPDSRFRVDQGVGANAATRLFRGTAPMRESLRGG